MKVAIATSSKLEFDRMRNRLFKEHQITNADETVKDGLYQGVYDIKESRWSEIMMMFQTIERITGINPYKRKPGGKGGHHVTKVKAVAAVVLFRRFEMTFPKIAKLLGYKSHASPITAMRHIKVKDIKNVPLELAVRKLLNSYEA